MKRLKLALARSRRWFAGPAPFVPKRLMPLLAGGCALLLLMMTLSPPSYRNSPSIGVGAHPRAASAPQGVDPNHPLPVLFAPMEAHQSVSDTLGLGDPDKLQNRVAINILLRSGYLISATRRAPDGPEDAETYHVRLQTEVTNCARGAGAGPAVEAQQEAAAEYANLAIAAVAAEKFNRTSLHRAFKWKVADMYLKIIGHLPDMSLGPAQIRPSTLRKYAQSSILSALKVGSLSDVQLRKALADECQSLLLANGVLKALADENKKLGHCDRENTPSCTYVAVLLYGGHRHNSGAVLDYAPIVTTIESMLSQ